MIARISTLLKCTEPEFWQRLIEPESLQYVAAPILSFKPVGTHALEDQWRVGATHSLELYFMKILPLGLHTIQLVKIDREANTLESKETGRLARVWNHKIWFKEVTPGKVSYTDDIKIKAGWLTPAIVLFAHWFYRHRQRRWKMLLTQKENRNDC